jgi:hypothetical protein
MKATCFVFHALQAFNYLAPCTTVWSRDLSQLLVYTKTPQQWGVFRLAVFIHLSQHKENMHYNNQNQWKP